MSRDRQSCKRKNLLTFAKYFFAFVYVALYYACHSAWQLCRIASNNVNEKKCKKMQKKASNINKVDIES